MKNYDDLQRFKDKTRTGDINFKDFSAQNKQASNSGWAIINQLAGVTTDTVLAQGGSIAVPIPQAVKPGELDAAFAGLTKTPDVTPTGAPPSILQSLNAESADKEVQTQLNPAAPSLFDQLRPEAAVKETPAVELKSGFLATPTPAPVAAPVAAPAPVEQPVAPKPVEPVRFDQLFATKASGRASHPVKDLPLQPLLEKIASCR